MTLFVLAIALAACQHDAPPAPPAPPVAKLCGTPTARGKAPLCDILADLNETAQPADGTRVIFSLPGKPALVIRAVGAGMTVKRLDHGKLDLSRSFALSGKERHALSDAGAAWRTLTHDADEPTADCRGFSYIVAETGAGRDYKYAVSICFALGPLRSLVDAYLAIATEHVPELKQGLEHSLD